MKVLFASLLNEYGIPTAGSSFEYSYFYGTLARMPGIEVAHFATDAGLNPSSRGDLNASLVAAVDAGGYDLLFCFLFRNEILPETIASITRAGRTRTFNWFADDHWRLPVYSRFYAPLFTAVSTTDSLAVAEYARLGIHNVIKTQWAANPTVHRSTPSTACYGMTFVGQNYAPRGRYVEKLQAAGMPVQAFGAGWPAGRATAEQALQIFSSSAINLNFSETPFVALPTWKLFGRLFIANVGGQYTFTGHHLLSNFRSLRGGMRRQIKARVFEIPACGGFELTGFADDDLGDYYEDGSEIVVFKSYDDLIAKSRYYLAHPDERERIARAAYERTVREHTYERRFKSIFERVMA